MTAGDWDTLIATRWQIDEASLTPLQRDPAAHIRRLAGPRNAVVSGRPRPGAVVTTRESRQAQADRLLRACLGC